MHQPSRKPTHESTQHRNTKLAPRPKNGILLNANETTTEVQTMTTRYAEVAIARSIPVYDVDWGGDGRPPCWSRYVLFAMIVHQVP